MKQKDAFHPASSAQTRIIKKMGDVLRHGRLAHAYAITGPEGSGKEALAVNLARLFLCEAPEMRDIPRPCGVCRPCIKTGRNLHPDFFMIRPDASTIKMNQIRRLQQEVSLAPLEADRRVAIIINAHKMNQEAANALLKTLEEPPSHNHLIITASCADELLPTLVSRCQIIRCEPVPQSELMEFAEKRLACTGEAARFLSCLAEGSPAKAEMLLEQGALETKKELFGLFTKKGTEAVPASFRLCKKFSGDMNATLIAIQTLRSITRDLRLILEMKRRWPDRTNAVTSSIINQDGLKILYRLADAITDDKLAEYSRLLDRAEWMLERNVNQELVLEAALVFWIRKDNNPFSDG